MSLDVYLYSAEKNKTVLCYSCMNKYKERELFYSGNITHNLNIMADKAGIYEALWRPEEIGAKYARDIIKILNKGLIALNVSPKYYEQFNSPNECGTYEDFVHFVEEYLEACIKYPDAIIKVSR